MNDLDQAARDARNSYDREWRRKNREKVKQYRKTYWARKGEMLLSEQKQKENGGKDQNAT